MKTKPRYDEALDVSWVHRLGGTFVILLVLDLVCAAALGGGCDAQESPPPCSTVACSQRSTFTLTLDHQLPLDQGPHLLEIDTGLHEIRCSIGATLTGASSCFGYAFSDVEWTPSQISVVLIDPFYDADDNPESLPFESVTTRISRASEEPSTLTLVVESGEPEQPNGPDCPPSCWQATARGTLP